MNKEDKRPAILISTNGHRVTATLLNDGTHPTNLKVACAKCNPTDTFDLYEGCRIAVMRLFGREPFPEKAAVPKKKKPEPRKPGVFCPGDQVCVHKDQVPTMLGYVIRPILSNDGMRVRVRTRDGELNDLCFEQVTLTAPVPTLTEDQVVFHPDDIVRALNFPYSEYSPLCRIVGYTNIGTLRLRPLSGEAEIFVTPKKCALIEKGAWDK